MDKITITFTIRQAKFLSNILGHLMSLLLNMDATGLKAIDDLKVIVDEELLKI